MNGKKAKKLRMMVYGTDKAHKNLRYKRLDNGQIIAEPLRRAYQRLKKAAR